MRYMISVRNKDAAPVDSIYFDARSDLGCMGQVLDFIKKAIEGEKGLFWQTVCKEGAFFTIKESPVRKSGLSWFRDVGSISTKDLK